MFKSKTLQKRHDSSHQIFAPSECKTKVSGDKCCSGFSNMYMVKKIWDLNKPKALNYTFMSGYINVTFNLNLFYQQYLYVQNIIYFGSYTTTMK